MKILLLLLVQNFFFCMCFFLFVLKQLERRKKKQKKGTLCLSDERNFEKRLDSSMRILCYCASKTDRINSFRIKRQTKGQQRQEKERSDRNEKKKKKKYFVGRVSRYMGILAVEPPSSSSSSFSSSSLSKSDWSNPECTIEWLLVSATTAPLTVEVKVCNLPFLLLKLS